METNFNFFNSLIVSGCIQGILFAVVVLVNKKYKSRSNYFLAQVILYLSLSNLYFWGYDTKLSESSYNYNFLYFPWYLLILPCFYNFIIYYLNYKPTTLNKYLFYPFFLGSLVNISTVLMIYFGGFNFNLEYIHNIEEFTSIAFTIFVIYKTFYLILKYEKTNLPKKHKIVIKKTTWLKQLLIFAVVFCFLELYHWSFKL